LRLSVEKPVGNWHLAGNLIAEKAQHEDTELGYAFGARKELSEGWNGTLEARGSFEHGEQHELLAGLVWEQGQSLAWKIGAGAAHAEDGGYEPILHLGLIVRLRGD
jgi:hypothetical protein